MGGPISKISASLKESAMGHFRPGSDGFHGSIHSVSGRERTFNLRPRKLRHPSARFLPPRVNALRLRRRTASCPAALQRDRPPEMLGHRTRACPRSVCDLAQVNSQLAWPSLEGCTSRSVRSGSSCTFALIKYEDYGF